MNLAALSGATARMDPRQVETQNTLAVRRFSLSQEAKADKERNEKKGEDQQASDKGSRDSKGAEPSKKQSDGPREDQTQAKVKEKKLPGRMMMTASQRCGCLRTRTQTRTWRTILSRSKRISCPRWRS